MSKPRKKRQAQRPAAEPVAVEAFTLSVTRAELSHLRDLLSIVLPPDGADSVSMQLAEVNGSQSDAALWSKVWNLCIEAGLPIGEDAPNFVVGPAAPQSLAVFEFIQEEE